MALDVNSTVWTLKTWGGPIRLISPSLDCSSPETTPIQAECGPWYCAVLAVSGDAYAWWVNTGTFADLYRETQEISVDPVIEHEAVILCRTQELKMDPIKLPALPDLPDLPATGLPEEERRKETRLIKIATGNSRLIGLTNKGHVLKLDGMRDEDDTRTRHHVSENVRALAHYFKLWCTAAILLRYRQDQGDLSLPSNYKSRSEKTAASGRHPAHHPCK